MKTLIERIDHQLAQATDARVWVRLQATKAAHFARVGRFGDARDIISALRGRYAAEVEGEGIVWVMFAEGLLYFFEDYDDRAFDRLLRVRLLADAFAIEDIRLLSLVWLTHIEFNRAKYQSVAQLLGDVHDLEVCIDHSAPEFARLALNLGDVSAYCGNLELSKFWYVQARQAAINQGDDATTAAVLYNKPAMALFSLRMDFVNGALDPDRVRFAALEMEAAHGYQFGASHLAQSQLLFSCQARLHLLAGEYVQAADVFRRIFAENGLSFGFVSDFELLKLEYCYALAMSGDVSGASLLFDSVRTESMHQLNSDDAVIFCFLYPRAANLLDLPCDDRGYAVQLQSFSEKLLSEQQLLIPKLLALSEQLRSRLTN